MFLVNLYKTCFEPLPEAYFLNFSSRYTTENFVYLRCLILSTTSRITFKETLYCFLTISQSIARLRSSWDRPDLTRTYLKKRRLFKGLTNHSGPPLTGILSDRLIRVSAKSKRSWHWSSLSDESWAMISNHCPTNSFINKAKGFFINYLHLSWKF